MNSNLVKKSLEIVDAAVGLPETERDEFLDQACRENPELKQKVEYLLRFEAGVSLAPLPAETADVELPDDTRSASRYTLGEEIARGGMGVIILAKDRDLDREVAVKVLRADKTNNRDALTRFLTEARIGASLQHPGIAPVYDFGLLESGRPFFAMKYVRGETLSRLLSRRTDPTENLQKYLAIFDQVCQTVAYAHSLEVIHRDLKPENIMVGQFGEVQVMDWGLAKRLSSEDRWAWENLLRTKADDSEQEVDDYSPAEAELRESTETQLGVIMGSPSYMPPEQAVGQRGKPSDVFALGAILCEILTGKPAYESGSTLETFSLAAKGDTREALQRLDNSGCDKDLIQLTKNCLHTSPQLRWQDASEVADAITHHLESTQSRMQAAEVAAARAAVIVSEERRRRLVTFALVLTSGVLLATFIGLWVLMTQQKWMQDQEESAAQIQHEFRLESAIAEAHELHQNTASQSFEKSVSWVEANAAVARVQLLLDEQTPHPRWKVELHDIQNAIETTVAERKLISSIVAARDKVFTEPEFEQPLLDFARDNLSSCFFRYGIHPEVATINQAAQQIAGYSPSAQTSLIGALDNWLLMSESNHRRWLAELLSQVDRDPWRHHWRVAYMEQQKSELVSLLHSDEII